MVGPIYTWHLEPKRRPATLSPDLKSDRTYKKSYRRDVHVLPLSFSPQILKKTQTSDPGIQCQLELSLLLLGFHFKVTQPSKGRYSCKCQRYSPRLALAYQHAYFNDCFLLFMHLACSRTASRRKNPLSDIRGQCFLPATHPSRPSSHRPTPHPLRLPKQAQFSSI